MIAAVLAPLPPCLQERTDLLAHDIRRGYVTLPALQTDEFVSPSCLFCARNCKHGMTTGGVMLVSSFEGNARLFRKLLVRNMLKVTAHRLKNKKCFFVRSEPGQQLISYYELAAERATEDIVIRYPAGKWSFFFVFPKRLDQTLRPTQPQPPSRLGGTGCFSPGK
jgi:hypothetical protein